MRHARADYNRIQDPEGKIPVDEPVFLLRATDRYAADVMLYYAEKIAADPLAPAQSQIIAKRAREHAKQMREWADEHGVKSPDMPEHA